MDTTSTSRGRAGVVTPKFSDHFLNFLTELEIEEAVYGHFPEGGGGKMEFSSDEGDCLAICRREVDDVFPILLESSKRINQVVLGELETD